MEGCGGGFAVGQFSQQAVEDFNAAIGVHVDNSAQQAVVYIFQCCSFYIEHVVTSNGNAALAWSGTGQRWSNVSRPGHTINRREHG